VRPWALGLVLLGTPALAAGQSLYRDGGPGAMLFVDHRARGVNDIVTILVVEQSSSSRTAKTSTAKDSSRSFGVNDFPTVFDPVTRRLIRPFTDKELSQHARESFSLDVAGQYSHEGTGNIDRTDRVSGQIAARIVKVLDSGNFLIEGRRAIVVNNETQVMTISGAVRPQDITAANTVLSTQIADAEVQLEGRGVLADAQRPGLLFRLWDWLRLF
jgi:flagellar L-ring protein precursor FlgH